MLKLHPSTRLVASHQPPKDFHIPRTFHSKHQNHLSQPPHITTTTTNMLAIQKSSSHKGKCTPHLLPCRIHHNGPVNASKRYWDPKTTAGVGKESKPTSYFRGRKLHGKTLAIPQGYRGVILARSDRVLPPKSDASTVDEEAGDGEEEGVSEVKIVEEQAEFGRVVVWGHECLPDEMADAYCRGVEEWIGFAEVIHGVGEEEGEEGK